MSIRPTHDGGDLLEEEPELATAARRVLRGDDSSAAAAELERRIHDADPSLTDDLEELVEALALYAPAARPPYVDHRQLCEAIRRSGILD